MSKMTRREFLKGTAVAAASVAAMSAVPAMAEEEASLIMAPLNTAQSASEKWAFEIAPEPITDIAEEFDADVVVVGGGTSGLVTAVSAAEHGLNVTVVTAASVPISRGGSNNAAYSKKMEEMGIPRYSPEQIRKEIALQYNSVDQKKWYKHYNNSEYAMNWLIDLMAEAGYDVAVEQGPSIDEDDIYFTAPSAHGFINEDNDMVGMTQPFVVNALADKLVELGGQILFKHIGRQLVRGGVANGTEGRVTGVICEREDGTYAQFNGSKAVVLATGDFSADRDMMMKYCPWAAGMISDEVYDAPVNYDKQFEFGGLFKGDGQKMGLWVGAAWQHTYPNAPMGATITAGPSDIVYDPFWGMMVDRDGQRYMNEYCSSQMSGKTNNLQAGGKVFALWDKKAYNLYDVWYPSQGGIGIMPPLTEEEVYAKWDAQVEAGAWVKFDTLEEVCEALGLPVEETMASVAHYNEMCAAGEDTDFYKRADKMIPIDEAPFYGAASGPAGVLCILGGLRTDVNMKVCDANDDPIPGLYNVGTMIGDFYAGLYTFQMEGVNYGATCVCFGKCLGDYIAENE